MLKASPSADVVPTSASPAGRKLLVFELGSQRYALPLDLVREVLPTMRLAEPPGLPGVLAGFMNLEGIAVPVVRLARLLGLAESPWSFYTPLLLTRAHGQPLALAVDAVTRIVELDVTAGVALRQHDCLNDCAEFLMALDGDHVVVLSGRNLLREQEARRIAELAALEQARLSAWDEPAP